MIFEMHCYNVGNYDIPFKSFYSVLKGKKTPGKGSKTPNGGDRFIPNRNTTQFELGHYKLMQEANPDPEDEELMSPSKLEYRKVMGENLNGDIQNKKIISYKTKAPVAPEGMIHVLVIGSGNLD